MQQHYFPKICFLERKIQSQNTCPSSVIAKHPNTFPFEIAAPYSFASPSPPLFKIDTPPNNPNYTNFNQRKKKNFEDCILFMNLICKFTQKVI